jgi:YD repeat-containing protein
MAYSARYDSGLLQDIQFVLDPVVLSVVSGDGQTIPVNTETLQKLVVELNTASGVPVNFPISVWGTTPKTTNPTATIVGPSRSNPQIVSVDFLGGNKFGITAQVGSKDGAYTVSVKHADADPNQTVDFTIDAVAELPPDDDKANEQGNGNTNDDPEQRFDDKSLTEEAEQQNNKGGGTTCGGQSVQNVADPINVTNGNVLRMDVDYAQTGLSPIEFTRTYNSKGSVSALMGNYWTTTYDRFVIPATAPGDPLRLRRPDGLTIRFTDLGGGAYAADASFHGTLQQTGSGWRYIETNQTVEDYSSSGKLTAITDLRGRVQSLTYSKGLLTKVTANTGESLTFSYTNGRLSSVKDQASRLWSYTYDGYDNLTSVKYPDGTYHSYFYSDRYNPYHLTGLNIGPSLTTDEGSSKIEWEYDAYGNAIASYFRDSVLGQLKRTDILFDADGVTRTVMDGNRNNAVYATQSMNGRGFVNSIAGPGVATCGNDLTRQFDAAMNVISKTQAGHVTAYSDYDSKGQFANRTVAVGTTEERSTDYLYDPRYFNKPIQITEPSVVSGLAKVTTLAYDNFGDVMRKTVSGYRPNVDPLKPPTPVSRTWTFTYDGPYHQLSRIDGPRDDVVDATTFGYDAAGRLQRVTDADSILRRDNIAYTSTGNVASEDRPNGLHVAYSYYAGSDLLQSVTETKDTSIRTTSWSYDYNQHVTGIIFSDGVNVDQAISFAYNNAGELNYVNSAAGTIKYTFDDQGNPTRDSFQRLPQGEITYIQRTFDAYNRIDKVIGANNTIDYDFYPDGTLTQTKDGKQQLTKRFYDGLRRLTKVVRPDLSQIQYGYDAAGNLDEVIDPNLATTTYVLDDLHNKVAQISPDTGTAQFDYDPAGNLSRLTDADGHVTKYTYDAGNRLLTVDREGGDYDETYGYDSCVNGVGSLCSVTNSVGEIVSYEYDDFGEISKMTTGNAGVSYRYDAQGHVSSITYPSGRTVNYLFNTGGQVTNRLLRNPPSLAQS